MNVGNDKFVPGVQEGERGEILFTDGEGKQTTYYPFEVIRLEVRGLDVVVQLIDSKDTNADSLLTRVQGTAILEHQTISVIGYAGSKRRQLPITFHASDWRPPSADPKTFELSKIFFAELGGAQLHFSASDWSMATDDNWQIECTLPENFVRAMADEIRKFRLGGVSLTLHLQRVYTSTHQWEPNLRGELFIRPDRPHNAPDRVDIPWGYVSSIEFTSAARKILTPATGALTARHDEPPIPGQEPDPLVVTVAALASRVEQLHTTIRWVGALAVAALLFVAAR